MSGSEDENDSDAERQNGNGAEEDSPPPFRPAGMRPAGSMRPGRRGSSPAVFGGGGMLGRLQ